MKLTKCDNGHFYDGDKYPECPYCNTELQKDGGTGIVVPAGQPGEAARPTLSAESSTVMFGSPTALARASATLYGPVTGWLVALNGPAAGTDYRLGDGRSFFGLGEDGTPALLTPDAPLSARLLVVAYDAATGEFTALPGDGRTLAYLNGKANLTPMPLKNNDEIALGDTKLRFIAFCGGFRWPKAVRSGKKPAPAPEKPALKPEKTGPAEPPKNNEAAK